MINYRNILIALLMLITFFLLLAAHQGCTQATEPNLLHDTYKSSYDDLPPQRPPLPCGWYAVNDSTWGYDSTLCKP